MKSVTHNTVDVVMATYNGAPFVAQQIESILSQDYPAVRLIIRDDSSTDGTLAILEGFARNYPERIIILPSDTGRLGIRGNFSLLMAHARADYVMLADQDDVWHQTKITKTLAGMKLLEQRYPLSQETTVVDDKVKRYFESSNVASRLNPPLLVHTDLTVVDQHLQVIAPSFWRHTRINAARTNTLNRLLVQPVVTGCTVMMNRSLLNLVLPIPEICVMHDSWIALVAAAFGHVEALPDQTVFYRQHGKNAIGAKKFYSFAYWREGMKKLSESETKKFSQGKELLSRYGSLLDVSQKTTLQAYLSLKHASFFQRCSTIYRHQLFRCGFIRNAIALFIRLPNSRGPRDL
ncbi:MAG: glycosyltransferase family 2 protein [Parachlamydiaceae bacterium]